MTEMTDLAAQRHASYLLETCARNTQRSLLFFDVSRDPLFVYSFEYAS